MPSMAAPAAIIWTLQRLCAALKIERPLNEECVTSSAGWLKALCLQSRRARLRCRTALPGSTWLPRSAASWTRLWRSRNPPSGSAARALQTCRRQIKVPPSLTCSLALILDSPARPLQLKTRNHLCCLSTGFCRCTLADFTFIPVIAGGMESSDDKLSGKPRNCSKAEQNGEALGNDSVSGEERSAREVSLRHPAKGAVKDTSLSRCMLKLAHASCICDLSGACQMEEGEQEATAEEKLIHQLDEHVGRVFDAVLPDSVFIVATCQGDTPNARLLHVRLFVLGNLSSCLCVTHVSPPSLCSMVSAEGRAITVVSVRDRVPTCHFWLANAL